MCFTLYSDEQINSIRFPSKVLRIKDSSVSMHHLVQLETFMERHWPRKV